MAMVQLVIPEVGVLLGGCPGLHLWCGGKLSRAPTCMIAVYGYIMTLCDIVTRVNLC